MGGVHNLGTENPDDLGGHMEKNKLHVYSEREITLGVFITNRSPLYLIPFIRPALDNNRLNEKKTTETMKGSLFLTFMYVCLYIYALDTKHI